MRKNEYTLITRTYGTNSVREEKFNKNRGKHKVKILCLDNIM